MMKRAKLAGVTEAEFQQQVLELAKLRGWLRAHFRPGRTKSGWRTAVSGDGAGFPDLVLVRPPRLIFAELKRNGGKVSHDQLVWLTELGRCQVPCGMVEVYLWRPIDWKQIELVLV